MTCIGPSTYTLWVSEFLTISAQADFGRMLVGARCLDRALFTQHPATAPNSHEIGG